jgi:hypothetical protein
LSAWCIAGGRKAAAIQNDSGSTHAQMAQVLYICLGSDLDNNKYQLFTLKVHAIDHIISRWRKLLLVFL